MSENLVKLLDRNVETKQGAEMLALSIYLDIERHHGEEEARRIFARLGKKPTPREINERKGFAVLQRFDMMQPRPNVDRLAAQLAGESQHFPPTDSPTPRGKVSVGTAKGYINELRRRRRQMIVAGTWRGPPLFDKFNDWGKEER